MRRYYVEYYADLANTYSLYYAEADAAVPETWERITRKDAERLARKERQARKFNSAFAFRADDAIYPAGYPDTKDILDDPRYRLIGCIWERVAVRTA